MPMGSPKEKRTTGASSASTPAKAPPNTSSKAPREAAPPATALVPPEWSASFQAFYDRGAAAAAVMPQAFYSPTPVATAQPVVWGAQVRCLIILGAWVGRVVQETVYLQIKNQFFTYFFVVVFG